MAYRKRKKTEQNNDAKQNTKRRELFLNRTTTTTTTYNYSIPNGNTQSRIHPFLDEDGSYDQEYERFTNSSTTKTEFFTSLLRTRIRYQNICFNFCMVTISIFCQCDTRIHYSCPRLFKLVALSLLFFISCLFIVIGIGFMRDVTILCQRPANFQPSHNERPLIEYFIHGRGNGHYSRSIAIIEKLNQAGIDVRMFIGRGKWWEINYYQNISEIYKHDELFSHQIQEKLHRIWTANGIISSNSSLFYSSKGFAVADLEDEQSESNQPTKQLLLGETMAFSVSSIVPGLSIISIISRIVDRIEGDCKLAEQKKRYPSLIVSDGDMPGILRAWLGSIPSVSISHGNFFAILNSPSWLSTSSAKTAWKKEKRLNSRFFSFSDWQIGTYYFDFPSNQKTWRGSKIVVPPRIRNEIIQMACVRQLRTMHGHLLSSSNTFQNHRPFILCYFRNRNGEFITDYLLKNGFHVILFLSSSTNMGQNWMKFGQPDNVHSHMHYIASKDIPTLIQISDPSLFIPIMSIVDGVISSADAHIINECAFAKIPLFTLNHRKDSEQLLNVEILNHLKGVSSNDSRSNRKTVPSYLFGSSIESVKRMVEDEFLTKTKLMNIDTGRETQRIKQDFDLFLELTYDSNVSLIYFQEIRNETVLHYNKDLLSSFPHTSGLDAATIILDIIKGLS